MEPLIVPSIIAKDQGELDGMLGRVRGKADRIMLDVMDGNFVPNRSLDFDLHLPGGFTYEAHLMIRDPLGWIRRHGSKVQIVILQVEVLEDVDQALRAARDRGLGVFLALNPETSLDSVLPHVEKVDGVLVLTVRPGSFCVEFLPETLEKVRRLRSLHPDLTIEVDGCMNPDHVRIAREAGANIFDSGSYVMESKDVEGSLGELLDAARPSG